MLFSGNLALAVTARPNSAFNRSKGLWLLLIFIPVPEDEVGKTSVVFNDGTSINVSETQEHGVATKAIEVVFGRFNVNKQLRVKAPKKLPSVINKHLSQQAL